MKQLVGAVAMMCMGANAGAKSLSCKARVPGRCGVGSVSVVLDLEQSTFVSSEFVTTCWSAPVDNGGTFSEEKVPGMPFSPHTVYSLKNETNGEPLAVLDVQHTGNSGVAFLTFTSEQRERYNLTCTQKE